MEPKAIILFYFKFKPGVQEWWLKKGGLADNQPGLGHSFPASFLFSLCLSRSFWCFSHFAPTFVQQPHKDFFPGVSVGEPVEKEGRSSESILGSSSSFTLSFFDTAGASVWEAHE